MDRIKDSGSFGPGSNPGGVTTQTLYSLLINGLGFCFIEMFLCLTNVFLLL